jgi:4-hydroxy-3-polyprenylbenzoate decarboxylase
MEDCWMMLAWERLLLAFLQKLIPSITEIHFPFELVFHQSAIISLENPQAGMVRNISARLWELPWFRSARILIFVGADSAISGLSPALWRSVNVTDWDTDCIRDDATGRIALDATGCREPRRAVKNSAECAARVANRWKEYGLS